MLVQGNSKGVTEFPFMKVNLDKSGLEFGDKMEIIPFLGRRKNVELKRTMLDFVTDNIPKASQSFLSYSIGRVGKEKLHYRLYKKKCFSFKGELTERYFFKSLCSIPFKVNGSYVMKSYVQKNDCIEMGHNTIKFKNKGELEKLDNFAASELSLIKSDIPILIEGETGIGKTRLARLIHETKDKKGPFIHININSFSSNLIESELFGHVKGAFTGAIAAKNGAFVEAKGGTLFIDEIDSLPIEIQTKLLIFLDEKKIRQVGADKDLKINCRLIFASGQKLEGLVHNGQLRKDFYYRLNSGMKITLAPLRDNLTLLEKICRNFEVENNIIFSDELIDFYKSLPWPGNIRQLLGHLSKKNLINQGPVISFDEFDEKLIFESTNLISINSYMEKEVSLEELKYKYVKKLLLKYKNNKSAVSKILGITSRSIMHICQKQEAKL